MIKTTTGINSRVIKDILRSSNGTPKKKKNLSSEKRILDCSRSKKKTALKL